MHSPFLKPDTVLYLQYSGMPLLCHIVFQHLLADPEVFSGQMMFVPRGFLCEGVAKLLQVASSGPQTQSMAEPEAPKGKIALYINS